jgi:hypothetical protein
MFLVINSPSIPSRNSFRSFVKRSQHASRKWRLSWWANGFVSPSNGLNCGMGTNMPRPECPKIVFVTASATRTKARMHPVILSAVGAAAAMALRFRELDQQHERAAYGTM